MRKCFTLTAICLVLTMLLPGCKSDMHYASSFIRHADSKNSTAKIYVVLPTEVIHSNSSLNEVEDFAYLSERQQDSVIGSVTAILDKLNDSIFISQFSNAFLYTLSRLRMPIVLCQSASQLPVADSNTFIVNIVQLEAEEFVQPSRSDFRTRKGVYYAYKYNLRHFSTNAWFQFGNDDVYFKNNEVSERFNGVVTKLKDQKATLRSKFERIGVNEAYSSARTLGTECATLYVEKMLTDYVRLKKGTNNSYFYYDAYANKIPVVVPYEDGVKESFQKL